MRRSDRLRRQDRRDALALHAPREDEAGEGESRPRRPFASRSGQARRFAFGTPRGEAFGDRAAVRNQRARFLAISEFGPGSLVYHEGRAYRVDRALLKDVGGGDQGLLPTFSTDLLLRDSTGPAPPRA